MFQSAPAIAGGRSRVADLLFPAGSEFQSAPAIAGGRSVTEMLAPATIRVSIRARHRWRAFLVSSGLSRTAFTFQSAPAIAGGRSVLGQWRSIIDLLFQSAPAIAGGRCIVSRVLGALGLGFNPRPPSLAGVARNCQAFEGVSPVSIRARHRWRALRCYGKLLHTCLAVSIRARHRWRALHAQMGRRARSQGFQSAPAIAGGRCPL